MTTLDRRAVLAGRLRHLRRRRDGLRRLRPRPARARARPAPPRRSRGGAVPRMPSSPPRRTSRSAAVSSSPTPSLVITQPKAGTFKAFSAICTHQGCAVSTVENGTINCPCHGSEFAITDGSVVAGPAPKPLPAQAIKVSGGSITRGA